MLELWKNPVICNQNEHHWIKIRIFTKFDDTFLFPCLGFKGIWGSGLAISAMMGVRDSNEASWTQITDVLDFMADATSVPILLDADTGFGNFNNARRLVSKLEQIGVAG